MGFKIELVFIIMVFVVITLIILVEVYIGNGTIIINKSYEDEYNNCKTELQKNQPACPAVNCDFGSVGLVWSIGTVILYLGAFALFVWNNKEWERRNRELKEREDEKIPSVP